MYSKRLAVADAVWQYLIRYLRCWLVAGVDPVQSLLLLCLILALALSGDAGLEAYNCVYTETKTCAWRL